MATCYVYTIYLCIMHIVIIRANVANETLYARLFLDQLDAEAGSAGYTVIRDGAGPVNNTGKDKITIIELPKGSAVQSWYWQNVKLPAIIKKYNPEKLIWIEGFIRNRFAITQYLLLSLPKQQLTKLQNTESCPTILTHSAAAAGLLQEMPATNGCKIESFPLFDLRRLPHNEGRQEMYFYARIEEGGEDQFVAVLKAFSVFKKWQLSGMQLAVSVHFTETMKSLLETYKFKSDVHINDESFVARSAYAAIYVSSIDSNYGGVLPYLQAGLPVICPSLTSFTSLYDDAVHYCDQADAKSFGTAMVELYRNEVLKNGLASRALQKARAILDNGTTERMRSLLENPSTTSLS